MKTSQNPSRRIICEAKSKVKTLGALTAASFALLSAGRADTTWNGSVSSDVTNNANYGTNRGSTAPTFNTGTSQGVLDFQTNGSSNPFIYTSAQGNTTFDNIYITDVGGTSNPVLNVTGGSLTVNTNFEAGQQTAAVVNISGGSLSVNGGGGNHFWVGNNSLGTVNVSGSGMLNVATNLQIARNGGQGIINISGNGILNLTDASGSSLNAAGGTTSASLINLSNAGIYEQTGSGTFAFTNGGASLFVNFLGTGNTSRFSLLGASTATLDGYITSGYFEKGGTVDTSLSDYTVIGAAGAGSQGIISLASVVPEPSTWAMSVGGIALLLGFQRLRRKSIV